ncbi:hypothetical protein IW138_001154 [Coemansia sp. RSA 986]|nr:hypothetical protein IW138_001154 [Coemansia sp. RSA 986]
MSGSRQTDNSHGEGSTSGISAAVPVPVNVARGVVMATKDEAHERNADHALWLLNSLYVPLAFKDMDNPYYHIIDVISDSTSSRPGGAAGNSSLGSTGSRHPFSHTQQQSRSMPHRSEKQSSRSMLNTPVDDISLLEESLDRKYKFTEDTVFWTLDNEYNVFFIIDISQSMYSLDPNTNETYIDTALETLEKCLMGMIQPFSVRSSTGLPDYTVEPHICASVVGYCPRPAGSYPVEEGRKKLPFCRTLAHAHMVTAEGIPSFIKSICNFLFNYESEITDSLGSFPPPLPPIPLDIPPEPSITDSKQRSKRPRHPRKGQGGQSFESFSASGKAPRPGDSFTFTYDPDAPLLHTMQIADYFLKIMPEICSPAFVYLTDGVAKSHFAVSKAQEIISSLVRRNTRCTFVQVGSCGGFTPETTFGYVSDNELLFYLAASLNGRFIYASDCPDTVLPHQANFYHQVMLIRETRIARTPVRHRYDHVFYGGRRIGDFPRERLNINKDCGLQVTQGGDPRFPWCSDSRPPSVETVTARYTDYNMAVNIGVLVEARMNEGFSIRSIQVAKFDRDGLVERVDINLELVWHPNVTVIYRIKNVHYMALDNLPKQIEKDDSSKSPSTSLSPSVSGSRSRSDSGSRSVSEGFEGYVSSPNDRSQRGPNMVEIMIRAYNMFTLVFLRPDYNDKSKGGIFLKVAMLHDFLKSIDDKDKRLRQIYSSDPGALDNQQRIQPPVFIPPAIETISGPLPAINETIPLASRIFTEEVDPSVFLSHTDWDSDHYRMYDTLNQISKSDSNFKPLASFSHVTSMFIDPDLILSYVDGINFTEAAKHGQRIMNEFRAHVCQAGTWALLGDKTLSVVFLRSTFRQSHQSPVFIIVRWEMATNWILRVSFYLYNGTVDARKIVMDCLPTFSESFHPDYRDPHRESVVRATRPLHLLPMDLDIVEKVPSNLLSTRDMGDLHTYVVEWRWTYLAREGKHEDLSGEGSDSEIVRQALHRLALTLGYHRLGQDFTLVNAKGESTGLIHGPDASKYDSCITFFHEREGYDVEELLLACQYQIVVDMKQSSVTARTWIEPWSSRFIRMLFEDDFRLLAPLGTFQQILQPERCFQLKVPNIAEFHSKRMNMFSIMAVVNSSRIALRMLQLPDISPGYAVWNHPDGSDNIKVDDPTFEITREHDPDEDLEVQILDENGDITEKIKATEYYKTHGREETREMIKAKKVKVMHVGSKNGERRAILLERFMLTLFEKNDEGKYDPHIEKYRLNEYNPFILAMINPGHPRKLFFNKLTTKWMTTGEFTTVAHRCFLEFALFQHCNAISVNAERFNKLRFASSIVNEMMDHIPGMHLATGIPNGLDEHLYMDKWFVIRLPNNSSFLMVILPNVALSAPNRQLQENDVSAASTNQPKGNSPFEGPEVNTSKQDKAADDGASQASNVTSSPSSGSTDTYSHRREVSDPAAPPVFTPALEQSILGDKASTVEGAMSSSINSYTLVMECSMDHTEMRRQVRSMDGHSQIAIKTKLNLRQLNVPCDDTKVHGESFQGFVGQKDIPIPFTDYALEEIKQLERMYSEANLQTIYLALLLKRKVSELDLISCQQSTLWKKQSIDVDITAFLHSQDVARISRDIQWQAADRQSLQEKFMHLLCESFTPLPIDVDPSQGRYYYCKTTPDKRSELEVCLQLALNPLFVNLQCSVEVLDGDIGYEKRLNMPIDNLPQSLELLCEQAGIPWRPPTDHFEPLKDVRVILHINCLYLPNEGSAKPDSADADPEAASEEETKILHPKPDKHELESRSKQLFQNTMSLSSLVHESFDPVTIVSKNGTSSEDSDLLPSAIVAKQHINAQMATLKGLPHDQLELVRYCHRRFVRFIAQETLYALRDTKSVTVPLLNQVWHTIATTVDEDVPLDRFEFSQNKLDLNFAIDMPDAGKRSNAVRLVMAELLKQDSTPTSYPLGRLESVGDIVYTRDVRSRSARIEAGARIRARAMSDAQSGVATSSSKDAKEHYMGSSTDDLTDAIPSWFLIKPTSGLDGVRILTHNYSIVTSEAAESVLAVTRQRLMVALKAANTRLLLEEMADSHRFPDLLIPPDYARLGMLSRTGSLRAVAQPPDAYAARDEGLLATAGKIMSDSQASLVQNTDGDGKMQKGSMYQGTHVPPSALTGGTSGYYHGQPSSMNPFNIASILKPYIPDNPEFYSCEEQFKHVFPLHPRISPPRAVQAVLASGMMNNRLVNQRNMFFVRDGGSIFYALLAIDRIPYVNPFNLGGSGKGPKAASSLSSMPGQTSTFATPMYSAEAILPGAHTVATTSPNPNVYESFRSGSRALFDLSSASFADPGAGEPAASISASQAQLSSRAKDDTRRRSPFVQPINTERSGSAIFVSTASAANNGVILSASIDGTQPASPRLGSADNVLRGNSRYSLSEAVTSYQSVSATPESPSSRHLVPSLTNLEDPGILTDSSRRLTEAGRSPGPHQTAGLQTQSAINLPQASTAGSPLGGHGRRLPEALTADPDAEDVASPAGIVGVGSRGTQPPTAGRVGQFSPGAFTPSSEVPMHIEERTIPCLVLYLHGVDKPRNEMTQSLVQKIRERIAVHVTMPEISDMLLRRVALNDHDMDFLFPKCNPEPIILYMPLPKLVHDVDRLMMYLKQAMSSIISPFPHSDMLTKAIWRTFAHLRRHRSSEDVADDGMGIGARVPRVLKDDISHIMEGWEYDGQMPARVPLDRMTFLYNFCTMSGAPPQVMTDIGTGVAIVAALPLTKDRMLPRGIWEDLAPSQDASAQYGPPVGGDHNGGRQNTHGQNSDDVLTMASGSGRRASQSSAHRRAASYFMDVVSSTMAPIYSQAGPLSPSQQPAKTFQRRASHTPSSHEQQQQLQQSSHSSSASLLVDSEESSITNDSPNPTSQDTGGDSKAGESETARTISGPEIAGLFGEYLRQCKDARMHLRLDPSEFSNVAELMEKQVDEFKDEQVVAITVWSNASVKLDRLLAYVSRVYWNALGDYVSENILHPILYTGWGDLTDPLVKVPDPFASLDTCNTAASFTEASAQPKCVLVPLYSMDSDERLAAQARLAMLRAKESKALRAPSTFTETTKMQMHAMEIARQMAQYWGRQETVQSMSYHQQKLPRVTGISHWFSDELYDVLQTMCPAMHPARFRLLENPLVLNSTDREIGDRPKSLFPAHSLRKPNQHSNTNVVYDLSALPKVLKGTRQSFCIMCTLPLEELASQQLQRPASSSYRGDKAHSSGLGPASAVSYAQTRRVDSLRRHNPTLGHQRVSTRSSLSSGVGQPQIHGLGLQGLLQSDGSQNTSPHPHNQQKGYQRQQPHYSGSQKHSYGRAADVGHLNRRPYRLPVISERRPANAGPKKMPPPSDYKSIADPEMPVLGVDEITHYPLHVTTERASNIAWLVVWLIGGELEMVGYNVSQRLWDNVCDQIKQRLERESRRKQLLGMFASHMGGIFPGFDRKAQHKGISSTWLDRNVTRDLINKFALQKQVAMDDQIHYFNIERHLSEFYRQLLGAYDGSEELEKILASPPVADMTLNDMKNELVLRQLQPEHLRWARKLTFVDYTQPYVDTRHPDTLFRIGSRFMRAYQGRIWNVLRYDELMRIAEQWRQMAVLNGLSTSIYGSSRLLSTDMHTESARLSSQEGFGSGSGSGSGSGTSFSQALGAPAHITGVTAKQTSSIQSNARAQAPARGDQHEEEIEVDKEKEAASNQAASGDKRTFEISLENIRMVMESARLLHFVCAPIPISRTIKPTSTDLLAFKRLFYVISAMLQNLADNYIDYLCSTGYAIAKRYEKEYSWSRALESLGYPPDKVSSFTKAFVGKSDSTFVPSHVAESQTVPLPSIVVPCAYLFANTERSNLVTEVEVNPDMLSIRVYALGRFTPGWRSSVPGYVRSTVNQHSIKNFTFELSKFKKLLHAKSFVYDFQLRYVSYLLKPADSISLDLHAMAQKTSTKDGRLADRFCKNAVLYSSESDSESAYEFSDSTDSDLEETAYLGAGTARPQNLGHAKSHSRSKRKVVAQVLHVHIDLTVFFGILSQQRYYSTRFSSRRLVRTRFPVMHREMYEYFLDHSRHYYFYTEGCKPPMQGSVDSPLSDRVPAADICTDSASHSGCYRLYDGMFSETTNPHTFGSEMGSDPDSFVWQPVPIDRSSYFYSGSHGYRSAGGVLNSVPIASSAPVPASRMDHVRGKSSDVDHGKQPHLHPFNRKGRGHHLYTGTDLTRTQSYTTGAHSRIGDRGKQASSPIAGGSRTVDGLMAHSDMYGSSKSRSNNHGYGINQTSTIPSGTNQYAGIHSTTGYPGVSSFSPSPLYNSRSTGRSAKDSNGRGGQQAPVSAWKDTISGQRSFNQEASEYSLCKIHLSSTDTSVRVSLMALTPDCGVCLDEDHLESQRRKERQLSHSDAPGKRLAKANKKYEQRHHRQHHHHRHHDHDVSGQMHSGNQSETMQQHSSSNRHGGTSKRFHAIDNVSDLFSLSKGKSNLGIAHKSRLYHPHMASATATNINAPRQNASNAGTGDGGMRGDQHPKRSGPSRSSHSGQQKQLFQRWMESLSSSIITDLEMDGLCSQQTADDVNYPRHMQATAHGLAQLSYYLVVDMDPQTTLGLSNLCASEARSRNGSLGQLPDCLSDAPSNAGDKLGIYGMRQCGNCERLSRGADRSKLCTTHKILSLVRVDMRDWENKGEVWASEPTMVMEVSNIDPNEYDKEDPDVLHWIKKTTKRIIRYTALDYHRDINWYRICQHLRMADLPSLLTPSDVLELVGFVERQCWEDVGAFDDEAQQLISLDIPAKRVIRSLQLRMRHLYLEPSLLMSSMCADPVQQQTRAEGMCGHNPNNNQAQADDLATATAAAAGSGVVVATPPSSPIVGMHQFSHSRHSTIDKSGTACAEPRQNATHGHVNTHTLPWNPLCPVAAIDSHGQIIPSRSSDNISEVLHLLSPLGVSVNRRTLLDPAFRKILGRYVQFDIVASPWLCKRHQHTTSAPIYKWSFNGSPSINADVDDNNAESDVQPGSSYTRNAATLRKPDFSTNKRLQQVQESDGLVLNLSGGGGGGSSDSRRGSQGSGGGRTGRTGASISSLVGFESASSLSIQPQTQSQALPMNMADPMHAHSYGSAMNRRADTPHGTAAGLADAATSSTSVSGLGPAVAGVSATAPVPDDYFQRALVEALPGSLLVIDPESNKYAARLLLLNPFSCHSMLELLFERQDDGKSVRLCQIRTVSRDRRRNDLYEHERKHINMVLSTVSAVVWDVLTQSTQ